MTWAVWGVEDTAADFPEEFSVGLAKIGLTPERYVAGIGPVFEIEAHLRSLYPRRCADEAASVIAAGRGVRVRHRHGVSVYRPLASRQPFRLADRALELVDVVAELPP